VNHYDASTYGERIAEVYDACYGGYEEAAIVLLADLAQGGRALELGIGTGRIALPLAARGIDIQGIDASPAMVAKLQAKPGGSRIPVTVGDFADVAVEGQFSLVFVVLNTFCALLSQAEQVRCFRNVAGHLAPGGVFVIEAFVPDMGWNNSYLQFARGQYTVTSVIDVDRVELDTGLLDPVHQRTLHQHVTITEHGIQLYPVQLRYVWPSELDLMAQLVGLKLRHRWGGWDRAPFAAASSKHVSIYQWADPE
jgi:SAM-dependent methyltransferase